MSQRQIAPLPEEECWNLLQQAVVGRIVFNTGDGPIAIPVNFGVGQDNNGEKTVVFRTVSDAQILLHLGEKIAFEVDSVDPQAGSGWSVLIKGIASETAFEDLPGVIHNTHGKPPKPWAEGVHSAWLVVRANEITGRQLGDEFIAW